MKPAPLLAAVIALSALAAAERQARASKAGLWRAPDPVPPWEWRATEKDRKRKPVGAGR